MAEDDQGGGEHDGREPPPGEQPVANVAGHRIPQTRPPAAARPRPVEERDPDRRRDERARHQRHRRLHGRRQHEEDDDGEDDLHELPGRALPCDGSQGSADIAHVAAMTDAAVNVADDSTREREVQEDRPVVRGDGGGQRQVDAQATRHDRPPPRTADRRHDADGRGRRQSPAVDRADAVAERACAQAPHDDGERRGCADERAPTPTSSE